MPVVGSAEEGILDTAIRMIREKFRSAAVLQPASEFRNPPVMLRIGVDPAHKDTTQLRCSAKPVYRQQVFPNPLQSHTCIFPVPRLVGILDISQEQIRQGNKLLQAPGFKTAAGFDCGGNSGIPAEP